MSESITIQLGFELTNDMIDAVMTTALEGGINYWCRSATPQKEKWFEEVEYASEALSKGIDIMLVDSDDPNETYILTKEKFGQGVQKYFENNPTSDRDLEYFDAEQADQVVQYALFGKIVFG